MGISDRLREERQRLGLNQSEAAKAGGISFTAYQNYERGDRHPTTETLAQWSAAGFDILYVVVGTRNVTEVSKEQAAAVHLFGKLNPRARSVVMELLEALTEGK